MRHQGIEKNKPLPLNGSNQPRWGQARHKKGLDVLRATVRILGKGYRDSFIIVFDIPRNILILIISTSLALRVMA